MPRSFQDIIDHADQLADAFEAWEPTPDQERPPTPEMLLRRAAYKRAEAERALVEAVVEARGDGVPWTAVGDALGTSAQAAQKRYSVVVSIRSATTTKKAAKKPKKAVSAKRGAPPRVKRVAATAKRATLVADAATAARAAKRATKAAAKRRGTTKATDSSSR